MPNEEKEEKKVFVAKSAAQLQKIRLNKLMSNPDKPVVIPDRPEEKLPRVFNPPEFVRNIWGSSAGAGSGDFHVYRGVRRREYARQKHLDEQQKKNDLDDVHKAKMQINQKVAEERTAKKRAKRQKKKMKLKMKKLKKSQEKNEAPVKEDVSSEDEDEESEEENASSEINRNASAAHQDKDSGNAEGSDIVPGQDKDTEDDSNEELQRKEEIRAKLVTQPEDAADVSDSDDEVES